jgi:ribosomal protein L11 methyltransferase
MQSWTPVAPCGKLGYNPPMQWIEAKVTFSCNDEALIVDLIADAFYSLGAKGVVVDDPHLEPVESWAKDAVARPQEPAVAGYLPADGRFENSRHSLEQHLVRLAARHSVTYSIAYQAIDEEDWAESWKAFFWPQQITPRIVVKPTWRDYRPRAGQVVIEIDPGMAFGTGTHPTTALCMRLLEHHLRAGQSVLDVGTGSGILLVAAAKLGASRLTGVDLDPLAVAVARRNLDQNHIDPACFELICGHLVDRVNQPFDVVVANILADVIVELLDDVAPVIKPGGIFICSGIIATCQARVAENMARCGFDVIDILKEGDWVALAGRPKRR